MSNLSVFISKYDFRCKKCNAELSPHTTRETALIYGIILLVGDTDGYIGWSCPKCDALVTNLTKVDGDPYLFIQHIHNHVPEREYLKDLHHLAYRSFPFISFLPTDKYVIAEGSPAKEGGNIFCLSKDLDPLNGGYLSFKSGSHAFGPMVEVYRFDIPQIENLLKLENKNGVKAFPRYELGDILRRPSIDNFCWNSHRKFYSFQHTENQSISNFSIIPEEIFIKKAYAFLNILESYNYYNIGFDLEVVYPIVFVKEYNTAMAEKINFSIYNDFSRKAWSLFNSDWMPEILNNLAEEFISDYLRLVSKVNCNRESVFNIVKSYIKKLYDTIISRHKRAIITNETRINAQKRVEEAEKCFSKVKIISEHKNINEIKIKISQMAPLKLADSFLILGERGTGKDLFARAIHEASKQIGQLVKIDCGAIPERLFESELFGYKKGAFTGALQDTIGKFGYAMGGTLFFDEIGNLPLNLQPKLLRALQDRQYVPVGSAEVKKIDAKFIFATNKDLNKMVEEDSFMPDLYDRLKRPQFTIPPLREIKNDVLLLANFFIDSNDTHRQANKELQSIRLSKDCVEMLKAFDWPGNIRELQQVIKEIMMNRQINKDRSEISASELPDDITQTNRKTPGFHSKRKKKLPGNTQVTDDEIIHWMKELGNNKSHVAKQLGVVYKTIWERCKKIGL